tara:strand:+ start:76 stop:285 length:210 start_codon:yes stop_codon:yes gene_type:complete
MPHYSHDPAITDPDPPTVSGSGGPLPGQITGCDQPPVNLPVNLPVPADPLPPAVELPDTLPYPDPHLPE